MFTFTVTQDGVDEPYELVAGSRDVSYWERTNHRASLGRLSDDPKMSDLEVIAHIAATRQKRFDGPLERFREEVDLEFQQDDDELADVLADYDAGDIDAEDVVARLREALSDDDGPGVDPTRRGRSTGRSSGSRSTRGSRKRSGSKKTTGRS